MGEVYQLLHDVQLTTFYAQIKDKLMITKLEHFDYLKKHDLKAIGMPKPAQRRLIDELKKRRRQKWFNRIIGKKPVQYSIADPQESIQMQENATYLISVQDINDMVEIAQGYFGNVYRAVWKSPHGAKTVAVKKLKVDLMRGMIEFFKEVGNMHCVRHSNIIEFHGVAISDCQMYMIFEYAPLGALRDWLIKNVPSVSVVLLWLFMTQLLAGLVYLESQRLVHRDIACRNILLTSRDRIKLADFGMSKMLPSNDDVYTVTEQNKLPFAWSAIESMTEKKFSTASDVWMFAVTIWEMYSFGAQPWENLSAKRIYQLLKSGTRLSCPSHCSNNIYQVLLLCWSLTPSDRPKFSVISSAVLQYKPNQVAAVKDSPKDEASKVIATSKGDTLSVIHVYPNSSLCRVQNEKTWVVGNVFLQTTAIVPPTKTHTTSSPSTPALKVAQPPPPPPPATANLIDIPVESSDAQCSPPLQFKPQTAEKTTCITETLIHSTSSDSSTQKDDSLYATGMLEKIINEIKQLPGSKDEVYDNSLYSDDDFSSDSDSTIPQTDSSWTPLNIQSSTCQSQEPYASVSEVYGDANIYDTVLAEKLDKREPVLPANSDNPQYPAIPRPKRHSTSVDPELAGLGVQQNQYFELSQKDTTGSKSFFESRRWSSVQFEPNPDPKTSSQGLIDCISSQVNKLKNQPVNVTPSEASLRRQSSADTPFYPKIPSLKCAQSSTDFTTCHPMSTESLHRPSAPPWPYQDLLIDMPNVNEMIFDPLEERTRQNELILSGSTTQSSLGGVNRADVTRLCSSIHGVTVSEVERALVEAKGDYSKAENILKINRLATLGLADRQRCDLILRGFKYDLEMSSKFLINYVKEKDRNL